MVTGSAVGSQSGSYLQASPSTSDEEMPTELSESRTNKTVVLIKPDKLSVKYTVDSYGNGRYDVGAVQANKPAPVNGKVYYFEMRVKNSGSKHRVAIGFTEEGFDLSRQPGWRAKSIGYHGDNGFLYRGRGTGMPFGASFATDDIVGAGINYASNEFFFTKNGAMVGAVRKDIDGPLFPTVAVHGQDEEVGVNFGQNPFSFHIKDEVNEEEWVSISTTLFIEALSAIFEQLGQSLAAMIMSYVGLLLCATDLIHKLARTESPALPSDHKLFGTFVDYFELGASIWQSFHSTLGYVCARRNKENPIRMSITMLLFVICVMASRLMKNRKGFGSPFCLQSQHYP